MLVTVLVVLVVKEREYAEELRAEGRELRSSAESSAIDRMFAQPRT